MRTPLFPPTVSSSNEIVPFHLTLRFSGPGIFNLITTFREHFTQLSWGNLQITTPCIHEEVFMNYQADFS